MFAMSIIGTISSSARQTISTKVAVQQIERLLNDQQMQVYKSVVVLPVCQQVIDSGHSRALLTDVTLVNCALHLRPQAGPTDQIAVLSKFG